MRDEIRKRLIVGTLSALLICVVLSLVGCDGTLSSPNGTGNAEHNNKTRYLVTQVVDTPDGWSESKEMCYYYHIDTKIVYFGTRVLGVNYALLNELKSADCRNYIYDIETNNFIGVE